MRTQSSTAARVFNIREVEQDIENALSQQPPRLPVPALPDYVEHRDGISKVGSLTAEAVVKEYELAAKEIEAMGEELKGRLEKLEQTKIEANNALAEIKETAQRYRDEGKRVFLQIEDCSMMTAEVRTTCGTLKEKIKGPAA